MKPLDWETQFSRLNCTLLPVAAVLGAAVLIQTLCKSPVRSTPLGKQILGLVVVEAALSVWIYVAPCAFFGSWIVIGDPSFCGSWFYLQLWFVFSSLMISTSIAVGVLLALTNKRQAIPALQVSPIIAMIVATSLVVPMSRQPVEYFGEASFPYCLPNKAITACLVGMVSLLIMVMLVVEIRVLLYCRRNNSCSSRHMRCVNNASRYILLTLLSYIPFNLLWIRRILSLDTSSSAFDVWVSDSLWAMFRAKCFMTCAVLWWTLMVAEGALGEPATEEQSSVPDSWVVLGFDLDCDTSMLRLRAPSILYDSFEGLPIWWRRPRSSSSLTTTAGTGTSITSTFSTGTLLNVEGTEV